MPGQLPAPAPLFALIFGLNLIPTFVPPTWMAQALVGFQYHDTSALLLAGTCAIAATLGTLTLAKISHRLLRKKLLSDAHRANIDVIKHRLEKRTTLTAGLFLFLLSTRSALCLRVSCSPPYGLTGLPLLKVALPFFIGRLAGHGFFIVGGAAAGRRFEIDSMASGAYAIAWFIGTQLLILSALYCSTRVDWKVLFDYRKLVWLPKTAPTSVRWPPSSGSGVRC